MMTQPTAVPSSDTTISERQENLSALTPPIT